MTYADDAGLSIEAQQYNPTPIINRIRTHVEGWRSLKNQADWGVTPATARLLAHWRHHTFEDVRPFFCQVEAVETIIWLTEVAPKNKKQYGSIWEHILGANEQANPELVRLAMKMATGSGKTTVMAMLIAWQTVNAIRSPTSILFSRGFLIIAPGITIRDRLRVLLPDDPNSYYRTREIMPPDLLPDIGKAKIVITNYHTFKQREAMELSKIGRAFLQGRGEPVSSIESEGQMLQRACGELLALKNVVVICDEAHHCYRAKPATDEAAELKGDEKDEAKQNNEAARLWISGIEALKRKVGVRAVYDLSATPFFLRGSGYAEGTLFPWTISDFSLMDAIECGIVKLPRIPVADNLPEAEVPIYRDLWEHIGKDMPKKGAGKSGELDPFSIPARLATALHSLYNHYTKVYAAWQSALINVPPVFIVVCNNTSTSKLVYEWISGFERAKEDGERHREHSGHLKLFRNYDEHGVRLPRPNTLLIDSAQLESGDALDKEFRAMAGAEIEQFKREMLTRGASQQEVEKITDADLLREVMNTVGKEGRLGADIRCVVSVSMLTEGWDTNTVTHILGVRAFGTQLLCEQVVGRALRRQSYQLNDEAMFEVEYADIRWLDEGYLECTGNTRKAMVTYQEIADKAVELIHSACQRAMGKDKGIKAILDPYNPRGSTTHVSFNTTKETLWTTAADKSHVNYVVCDSAWEAELARVVEAHPRVKAYVKNQGLQFVVPYRDGGTPKKYVPDFIVHVDDGNDDRLNIVVETKGYRGLDAQLKAGTMATQWVPGVNNLGTFGRWAFAEFHDVYEIEKAFAKLVDDAVGKAKNVGKAV